METAQTAMFQQYNTMRLAVEMYNILFYNLIESVSNCENTCKNAAMWANDGKSIHYLMGKTDAYKEVANRIMKERGITQDYLFHDTETYRKFDKLLHGQIEALEEVIPDNKVRGNMEMYHQKQRLVAAFSQEIVRGFVLGMNFANLKKDPKNKAMTEEELFNKLLECGGITDGIKKWIDEETLKQEICQETETK